MQGLDFKEVVLFITTTEDLNINSKGGLKEVNETELTAEYSKLNCNRA